MIYPAQNRRGLVGHWKYHGNVAANGTWYDISGNGNHCTLSGDASVDKALQLDSTSQICSIPATGSYNSQGNLGFASSEPFSISLWYKGTDSRTGGIAGIGLVSWGGEAVFAGLNMEDGFPLFAHYNGAWAKNIKATTFIAGGNWHHVFYINHGSNLGSLYIDGDIEISNEDSTISGGGTYFQPKHIGRMLTTNPTTSTSTIGDFNDVRIYNRALSAAEISQLYHQTKGRF